MVAGQIRPDLQLLMLVLVPQDRANRQPQPPIPVGLKEAEARVAKHVLKLCSIFDPRYKGYHRQYYAEYGCQYRDFVSQS